MQSMKGITPVGTLAFAKKLYSNKEKFSNDKFIGTLLLRKGVAENDAFAAERIARHLEAGGKADHSPAKDGDAPNSEGKVSEYNKGFWVVKFKSSKPVVVRDALKNKLDPKVLRAESGDTVRFAWGENIRTEGQWQGVALYLNGVQLIEKNAADADFEEVEGGFNSAEYEAPEQSGEEKKSAGTGAGFDF